MYVKVHLTHTTLNDVLFALAIIMVSDLLAKMMIEKGGDVCYVEFERDREMIMFVKWLDQEKIGYTIEDEPPAISA